MLAQDRLSKLSKAGVQVISKLVRERFALLDRSRTSIDSDWETFLQVFHVGPMFGTDPAMRNAENIRGRLQRRLHVPLHVLLIVLAVLRWWSQLSG